jgi:superfamily II DNA or RNA helicase
MEDLINLYKIYIYERVQDLLNSGKQIDDFDYKSDLHKIFEYFSCIKLTQEYQTPFYEYTDIPIEYKELNCMSKNDTGIDACNLIDTIVQCKLRTHSLTWKECSTFFGSNIYADENGKLKIRWDNLIITRNQESKLSDNLNDKLRFKQFTDKTYSRTEILAYCKELINNPPQHFKNDTIIKKRDYQEECIKLINDMDNENLIICLPTGTGKNFIITHSLLPNFKYLVLVPRIILMEQIKDEIIKYYPNFKNKIQLIGDSNREFNKDKNITICVFNSVDIIKEHINIFNKIFVDEAHHIIKPEIYKEEDEYDNNEEDNDDNEARTEQKEELEQEDENCDNKAYTKIIKEFSKLNNNVYLSATIDEHPGFKFYKKDIREMIENGYLCDYTINIPIFSEDHTNISVCKYLIKSYRNIIIYCNSHKDGKSINNMMNSIQQGCSEYIDCNTSRNKRNDIIANYKSGKLAFIVNVKILVEGFDAPITKGVCFMSLPSSSTTLIQIIGRALRLHKEKKIANVILPFSKMDDEKAICNFMKIMAKNDARIRKSYDNKKLGGYFDIINDDIDYVQEDTIKDTELKYEMIFNSIGTLNNFAEIWTKRFEEVKKYIDENNKKPSTHFKDYNIKSLGYWITNQLKNYKAKNKIMKDDNIYNTWTNFINNDKYKKYFLDNNNIWLNYLEETKKYIDENGIKPSRGSDNSNIRTLGNWIHMQQTHYKIKNHIMKDNEIYNTWFNFINDAKYKDYFQDNNTIWLKNLEELKKYIDENNKKPLMESKVHSIKIIGKWLSHQIENYKTKRNIMKDDIIYNTWTNFINDDKYKKYFLDNNIVWLNTFEKVKKYIDENSKRPTKENIDYNIKKLGSWITHQIKNYKLKESIMKDDIIYNTWSNFINDDKYKEYFLDNNTVWLDTLEKAKIYINENNKRPSLEDKNTNIKTLARWISTQQKNYKTKSYIMKDNIIYNNWINFINDDKYKEYFLDNNTIWLNTFEKVKKYIDNNNKKPSAMSKNSNIKTLGYWISTQQKKYKNKIEIMKDNIIYNTWTNFINDDKYKEYFN